MEKEIERVEFSEKEEKRLVYFKYIDLNQSIIKRLSRIGYFIKGFSITSMSIFLSLFISIEWKIWNLVILFIFACSTLLVFWIIDVLNLKNEKVFRQDYDYKRINWESMEESKILDLSYSFKQGKNNIQLKKSIFNFFTSIHLIMMFFLLIYFIIQICLLI